MRELPLDEVLPRVAEIVADVRARGDEALLDWTERLDGGRPGSLRVTDEELAGAELDERSLEAVRALAAAVEAVHAPQRPRDLEVSPYPGVSVDRRPA